MNTKLGFKSVLLLFMLNLHAADPPSEFALSVNQDFSNDTQLAIEIAVPKETKVFAIRYKLEAIDDKGFRDHIKPTKIFVINNKNVFFYVNRQFLHEGEYLVEVEVDHRKVRMFDWLKFMESGETKKVYLRIKIEKALGDEDHA